MSISQHKKKDGTTTIKIDGKIVDNIGVGKTKTPTAQNVRTQQRNTTETPTQDKSYLNKSFENFLGLSHANNSELASENTIENATVLWTIVANADHNRETFSDNTMAMLTNCADQLSPEEQKEFINTILVTKKDNQGYSRNEDLSKMIATVSKDNSTTHKIDSNTLNILSHSNDGYLCEMIAQHHACTAELAYSLIDFSKNDVYQKDIMRTVTNNETATPIMLETIAKTLKGQRTESAENIIHNILGNPNCPEELLAEYYQLGNFNYNTQIARNMNTPKSILTSIFNDHTQGFNRTWAEMTLKDLC